MEKLKVIGEYQQVDESQELLKVEDIAKFLRLTNQCVYRLTRENKIPHYRIGGSIRFRKTEFDAFLKAHFMREADIPVVQVQPSLIDKLLKKGKKKKTNKMRRRKGDL